MGLFDRLLQAGRSPADGSGGDVTKDRERADDLLAEGMRFEQEGRLEEALQRYEAAIGLNPALARAHFNRGNLLLDRGEAKEALEAYRKAVEFKPDSAGAHYNMGNAQLRLGHPEAAVLAYRQAIKLKPEFTDAQVALGSALQGLGQDDEAIARYRRALELKPDYVEVHFSLGNTLKELKRFDEAAKSYRQVLEIQPDNATVHYYLGITLHQLGRQADALMSYRRALDISPDSAELLRDQGIALQDLGQFDDAAKSYRHALDVNPYMAEVHNNLGNALKDLGQFDGAVASFRRALDINPGLAAVHSNLGVALQACGQLDRAAASYRRALEIDPDYVEVLNNLASIHKQFGQFDEALASYRRALEIRPAFADVHNNLGTLLVTIGRLDDAVASYRQAIAIDPDYADAHSNLGCALKDYGQFDAALSSIRRALEIRPDSLAAQDNLLFIQNYQVESSARLIMTEVRRYGEIVAELACPYAAWPNPQNSGRSLRVGLVSGDLRQHPVGNFLEGVLLMLSARPSSRLEFFAYPSAICVDEVSERIKACCKGWYSALGVPDVLLAQRIRDDGIDILIDLSGHTGDNRLPLFAWRPAPVQATWLGYLATTGVEAIDYLIADSWTLPATEEENFTEKIWRLPESYLCFTPPDLKIDVGPLPVLANGYITFGSFNNLAKMNDAVVEIWARVLKAVSASRLLLKSPQFTEPTVQQRTLDRFRVHDIDTERLILKALVPRSEYLVPYQQVDIALDPFPYPGITTSVEALWSGVPVLTLAGEHFLSRQGVGLMMNAGLPDWIASDADDYVARAVAHASDLQGLAALRGRLRQQVLASPIFDAARFAEHFEAALRGMWQKWCEQNADKQQPTDGARNGAI